MPIIKWNGGIELDAKTVIFVLSCAFTAGCFWYKLDEIDRRLTDHLRIYEVRAIQHDQMIMTIETLVKRMDACCPLAQKQVSEVK